MENSLKKLSELQSLLRVPKNNYNKFGSYYYRSAEDILEEVKPFLTKLSASLTIKESLSSLGEILFITSTVIFTDLESNTSTYSTGEAIVDLEIKGMSMPQRTGAASSYAKKYALGNLLLLDDNKDVDNTIPSSSKVKNLKEMTKEDQDSMFRGIKQGKFELVIKYLDGYKDNDLKKQVQKELSNHTK